MILNRQVDNFQALLPEGVNLIGSNEDFA